MKSLVIVLHWASSGLGWQGKSLRNKEGGKLNEGWILFKRGWKPNSVCCFCFVQVSREQSVDTTLMTAQITTARTGVSAWMVWTRTIAVARRNGQVRTTQNIPVWAGHALWEWNVGLLAFTQCTTGVAYKWTLLTSVSCSAVWGADVSRALKRKLISSKPPQWRAISHCTRQYYRLMCTWVWQMGTEILELQCSVTDRAVLLLAWITL